MARHAVADMLLGLPSDQAVIASAQDSLLDNWGGDSPLMMDETLSQARQAAQQRIQELQAERGAAVTVQLTEAGTESRSIMRWAWQDPPRRAAAALEAVHQMAAAASGDELGEIRDAVSMLTRLVSSLPAPAASGTTVSAQMAGPQTIGEQVELAALHGHHIPGTAYTMRHGWIPLIGPQLNDPYPQWFIDQEKRKAHDTAHDTASATAKATAAQDRAKRAIAKAAAAAQAGESPELMARRHATVPSAQDRAMTPAMRKLLDQHTAAIAKAQRAAEAAASPATPRTPGGSPATRTEAAKTTLPYYAVPPAPAPGAVSPGAASDLIRPPMVPPGSAAQRVTPGAAAGLGAGSGRRVQRGGGNDSHTRPAGCGRRRAGAENHARHRGRETAGNRPGAGQPRGTRREHGRTQVLH